jgi:hypothetical protein
MRKAPGSSNLERWQLLGRRQPMNRSLVDLEVLGDLSYCHDLRTSGCTRFGLGKFVTIWKG